MTTAESNAIAGLRVLVVEDEALIAEEIRDRLIRMGASRVEVADSGPLAIRAADEGQPDVILMDIRLKGEMDGIKTAQVIREHADIPVVFVTAHSDQATLRRARQSDAFGYVLKPFREEELVVTIEMALRTHAREQHSRQSAERLKATLSSIGYGVIATNILGSVVFMNSAAEWLTKWNLNEARGRPVSEVFSVVGSDKSKSVLNPAVEVLRVESNRSSRYSLRLLNRRRTLVPIEGIADSVLDSKGALNGAVTVFRRLPEHAQPEDSIGGPPRQVHDYAKMEAVTRLAGGIAHNFNNLLTVISGNAQLLLTEAGYEESQPKLREVLKASKRGATLIRHLLTFSQRQQLGEPEPLDLNSTIGDMEDSLRRMAGDRIQVNVKLDPAIGTVRGLPSQIEQLVLNLCSNACEAMADGGRLTIETSAGTLPDAAEGRGSESSGARYVSIAVTDTGLGMDPETEQHLFEPFFTTKTAGDAAGLGLCIAYGVVQDHGGYVSFGPNPGGKGTRFTAYLPLSESKAAVDQRFRGTESILVVEEQNDVRASLTSFLRSYGYRVVGASFGEALHVYRKSAVFPQVLVVDLSLPENGALDLTDKLTSMNPNLRILLISYSADSRSNARTIVRDEIAFLRKPYLRLELVQAIRDLLDR